MSRSRFAFGLLVSAAALVAGLALAHRYLPEWNSGQAPAEQDLARRFRALAAEASITLAHASPRVRLMASAELLRGVHRNLGAGASRWLAENQLAAQADVEAPGIWEGHRGRFVVVFSLAGEPWQVTWAPNTLKGFFAAPGPSDRQLAALLLRPGEQLAASRPTTLGGFLTVIGVTHAGGEAPVHLWIDDPPGGTIFALRLPGSPSAAQGRLSSTLFVTQVLGGLGALVLMLALVGLLFWLALKQRIDLINGSWLAILFLLCALPAMLGRDMQQLFVDVAVLVKAGWLLMLWSAAESVLRATIEGFTTSLDTLRRGRLGPRGGRALAAGLVFGGGFAGFRLMASALALPLAFGQPTASSVHLGPFALAQHGLASGLMWCAVGLLLYALLLHVLPGRWAAGAAALVTAGLLPPFAVGPWPMRVLAGGLLTWGLLALFRAGGLTAALSAAVMAFWLPESLYALRYPRDLVGTWSVGLGAILLVAGLAALGMRRRGFDEGEREARPAFVRRLEKQRRLSYEMELLARMQTGLLPQTLPHVPGYELTARSLIASEAGGDLYDFLRDKAGQLWIASGDVSGHGFPCAIAQATVKAALTSVVSAEKTPAVVLAEIDRVLRATLSERQFTALCLLRLDPEKGTGLLANAGHPFPLLFQPLGVAEMELPGLPLGQGPQRRYADVPLQLAPGGVLLLYSDGLYESVDAAGNAYGFTAMQRILQEAASWNAAEILERILWDWRHHLGGVPPIDDTTLVVLKRLTRGGSATRLGQGRK